MHIRTLRTEGEELIAYFSLFIHMSSRPNIRLTFVLLLARLSTSKPSARPHHYLARLGVKFDDIRAASATTQNEDSHPSNVSNHALEGYTVSHIDRLSRDLVPLYEGYPIEEDETSLVSYGDNEWQLTPYDTVNPNRDLSEHFAPRIDGAATPIEKPIVQRSGQEGTLSGTSRRTDHRTVRKAVRGFRDHSWQKGIPQEQADSLYEAIIGRWPQDIDDFTYDRCDYVLKNILRNHPKTTAALLSGDIATIDKVAFETSPNQVMKRVKGTRAFNTSAGSHIGYETDPFVPTMWLRGRLRASQNRFVLQRLAHHWGITLSSVMSRLRHYSQTHGLITSPEPLLGEDGKLFSRAAETIRIGCQRDKKVNIPVYFFKGCKDILHRASQEFGNESGGPFFVDYADWETRHSSERFNSHPWHLTRSKESIQSTHASIVRQWVPWLDRQYVTRKLEKVNEALQQNPKALIEIEHGNEQEAYRIAESCVEEKEMMRAHNPQYRMMTSHPSYHP